MADKSRTNPAALMAQIAKLEQAIEALPEQGRREQCKSILTQLKRQLFQRGGG